MSRPSFQFYTGDWQKNANLRRCSPAARGVWVDILCLLHDSDEYGLLRWPLVDIANAVGASMAHVRELVSKSVLKGADKGAEPYVYQPKHAGKLGEAVTLATANDGPLWYSSRLVRDEFVRQRRGESTRFDTANQPACRSPKGGIGERHGDGPSSSSSSSLKQPTPTSEAGGVEGTGDFTDVAAIVGDAKPTSAGLICRAMRQAGLGDTNPGHPRLLALIEAGATEAEFVGFVPGAVAEGKGFTWVLGAVEGERKRAKQMAEQIQQGVVPAGPLRGREAKAAELAKWAPPRAAQPDHAPLAEVIDMEAPHGTAPQIRG